MPPKENLRFLEETLKILIDYTLSPDNHMARSMLLSRHPLLRYREDIMNLTDTDSDGV